MNGIPLELILTAFITLPLRTPCRLEELSDGGEVRAENGKCQLPREVGSMKLFLVDPAAQP